MQYHSLPYDTILFHTIALSYHDTTSFPTIPYHTIPYHTIPYHTMPHHTIYFLLYDAISYHAYYLVPESLIDFAEATGDRISLRPNRNQPHRNLQNTWQDTSSTCRDAFESARNGKNKWLAPNGESRDHGRIVCCSENTSADDRICLHCKRTSTITTYVYTDSRTHMHTRTYTLTHTHRHTQKCTNTHRGVHPSESIMYIAYSLLFTQNL